VVGSHVASPAMDVHSRHTHPRWRAGDGSNSEVTLVSECHSGQATASGGLRPGLCASPNTVSEKEVRLGATRSIVETHICQERYCVKLLGVGRGDTVAAWPSQDRTPLNEPFERLVSDHRTPDTVYVVYSDSVLLYKDPPSEPIILRIRISNFGINKTNGPWRVACCMAKANANIDSV
jgi:hypothetical protein